MHSVEMSQQTSLANNGHRHEYNTAEGLQVPGVVPLEPWGREDVWHADAEWGSRHDEQATPTDRTLLLPTAEEVPRPSLQVAEPARDADAFSTTQRIYMVAIFCLTASLLYADQNLIAPIYDAIALDFGFSEKEKDTYIGGFVTAGFYFIGAPSALLLGYLCNHMNRRLLLFIVVILGEGPCIATYWVRHYWQFLVLRLFTGISLGGTLPIIFSLLADMFGPSQRATVAAGVQISTGLGMAIGQFVSTYTGTHGNWRLPFVIVAIPTLGVATLMLLTTKDPPRGATEEALKSKFDSPDFVYDEQLTWAKAVRILKIRSNLCVMLQGMPGSLPWGVLLSYFNSFLSMQKGLSVAQGTWVVTLWGLGGGIGVIGGGALGQFIYNRRKEVMPVVVGATVMGAAFPMWWLINAEVAGPRLPLAMMMGLLSGILASTPGPNIRAIILNVNEPETRGVAMALQLVLDDIGRGLGPALVAVLISALGGRQQAFNLAVAGWLPCGILLALTSLTLRRDERDMQNRLALKVALQSSRGTDGDKGEELELSNSMDDDAHHELDTPTSRPNLSQ